MTEPAPVAMFVYKRPDHTRQTIEALRLNPIASQTDLHIFSDAAKTAFDHEKVEAVRRLIRAVDGFKSVQIVERAANLGLANSVITGVSELFRRSDRLIVVEDDIVTTSDFLSYMNQALDTYRTQPQVFSLTGFNFPIRIDPSYPYDAYFSYRCNSWGWATWRDRWNTVDWAVKDYASFKSDQSERRKFNRGGDDLAEMLDLQVQGEIDSWAIRWCYAHYQNNAFCLFPVRSRVQNLGFDGTGVHCGSTKRFSVEIEDDVRAEILRFPSDVQPDPQIQRAFYRFNSKTLKTRVKLFLKPLLKLAK